MKAALLLALKSVPPSLSLAGHSELLRLTIPPPVFTRSHPRVSRGRSLTRNPARSLVLSAFKIGAPCWDLGADGPRTYEQTSKSNRWQRAHGINETLFPFHLSDYTTQLQGSGGSDGACMRFGQADPLNISLHKNAALDSRLVLKRAQMGEFVCGNTVWVGLRGLSFHSTYTSLAIDLQLLFYLFYFIPRKSGHV